MCAFSSLTLPWLLLMQADQSITKATLLASGSNIYRDLKIHPKIRNLEDQSVLPIFCLAVTLFAFVQGKREGAVLGTLCWPYCTEVILLRLVLLIFMIIRVDPQSTRAAYNCVQECGLPGVNVYILSSVVLFSAARYSEGYGLPFPCYCVATVLTKYCFICCAIILINFVGAYWKDHRRYK